MLTEREGYPIKVACDVLELPRSSYYYRPVEQDEEELVKAIETVAGEFPTYGTRRMSQQLRRSPYNLRVGRKKTRRIMDQKDLLITPRKRKKRTTDSDHPYPRYANLVKELEVTRPDQIWASDITYIRLKDDFVYLAVIMDVFTRTIRGWSLNRSLTRN